MHQAVAGANDFAPWNLRMRDLLFLFNPKSRLAYNLHPFQHGQEKQAIRLQVGPIPVSGKDYGFMGVIRHLPERYAVFTSRHRHPSLPEFMG